jgi:hypothetical protein
MTRRDASRPAADLATPRRPVPGTARYDAAARAWRRRVKRVSDMSPAAGAEIHPAFPRTGTELPIYREKKTRTAS